MLFRSVSQSRYLKWRNPNQFLSRNSNADVSADHEDHRSILFCLTMNVRLKGRTYDTGTAVTSPIFNRYGLVEFLQRGGSYADSLFGLYDNAIFHGCKINLRLVNTSSEPIILAVVPLPYNWVSGSPTQSR